MYSKYYSKYCDLNFLEEQYPKIVNKLKDFETKYAGEINQLSQFGNNSKDIKDFCDREFLPIFREVDSVAQYLTSVKGLYSSSFKRPHCDFESSGYDENLTAAGAVSDIKQVVNSSLNFLSTANIEEVRDNFLNVMQSGLTEEISSMKASKDKYEKEIKSFEGKPMTEDVLKTIEDIKIKLSNLNISDRESELKMVENKLASVRELKQGEQGSNKLGNNLGGLFNSESEFGKDSSRKQMN